MEGKTQDSRIAQVRKYLSLTNVSSEDMKRFDSLVEDFDLTVGDVTGWDEEIFFNPQEHTS